MALLVSSLSCKKIKQRLKSPGVNLQIGPFNINLRSDLPNVGENLHNLYGQYPINDDESITDFYINLESPSLLRRWLRPQATFSFDGYLPFKPLPQSQSFAMFEWGLNWCVANNAHQFLVIHSAVVEKNNKALIFPGSPGSGKSTLCAGLVSQGWRLLSDEMALLSLENGLITPIPRPISLKNQSIEIARSLSSEIFIGDPIYDTSKGTIAHMRAPKASIEKSHEQVIPAAVIFPKYKKGSETILSRLSKGKTFLTLAENSFNYHVLGRRAFGALTNMIEQCECFNFGYQHLSEAFKTMDDLVNE